MKKIHTDAAPAAVGPYSQAVEVNGMLYASGQIALDPATGELVAGGIEAQTGSAAETLKPCSLLRGKAWITSSVRCASLRISTTLSPLIPSMQSISQTSPHAAALL